MPDVTSSKVGSGLSHCKPTFWSALDAAPPLTSAATSHWRLKTTFWLDAALLASVCALETVPFTELIHEWLGLALVAMVIAHLLFSWAWIAAQSRRFFVVQSVRARINYLLKVLDRFSRSIVFFVFSGFGVAVFRRVSQIRGDTLTRPLTVFRSSSSCSSGQAATWKESANSDATFSTSGSASGGNALWNASLMPSSDIPFARHSRISATETRVPRMASLAAQEFRVGQRSIRSLCIAAVASLPCSPAPPV